MHYVNNQQRYSTQEEEEGMKGGMEERRKKGSGRMVRVYGGTDMGGWEGGRGRGGGGGGGGWERRLVGEGKGWRGGRRVEDMVFRYFPPSLSLSLPPSLPPSLAPYPSPMPFIHSSITAECLCLHQQQHCRPTTLNGCQAMKQRETL